MIFCWHAGTIRDSLQRFIELIDVDALLFFEPISIVVTFRPIWVWMMAPMVYPIAIVRSDLYPIVGSR